MRLRFDARLDASDDAIAAVVGDLATYPRWLGVVQEVDANPDGSWTVGIGGRVGLLRRTKRVRMVRTGPMRFERNEVDGEEHATWTLEARVAGGALVVELAYEGGSPLVGLLEPLLRLEAGRAPARLQAILDGS